MLAATAAVLKIYFETFTSEQKVQLTRNLVEGIVMNCRSKLAKIVQIGNPKWPPWRPSWKYILTFSFWTQRLIDLTLDWKYQGDL